MKRTSLVVGIVVTGMVLGMMACSKAESAKSNAKPVAAAPAAPASDLGKTKAMTKEQVLAYAKTLSPASLPAAPVKPGDTVLTEWSFGTYDLGTVDKVNGEMVHFVWKDAFAKGEKDKEVHASKVHVYGKPKEADLKPGTRVIVQKPGDYVDSMYVEGYVVDVLGPQQYVVYWTKDDKSDVQNKSLDHIWIY